MNFNSTSPAVVSTKIIGGINAGPNEFPYQVNLRYDNQVICGGAILSTYFVLTAAHCVLPVDGVEDIRRLNVVAGDHKINIKEPTEQIRNVSTIEFHPNYNKPSKHNNDLALLKLDHELEFNKAVKDVRWPRQTMTFSGIGTVAGWGRTMGRSSLISNELKKVWVPLIPHEECKKLYSKSNVNVTTQMLCAGEEGKDSCQGDSGSGMTCKYKGESFLCGIVSFGVGCAEKYPGVYVDVSKFGKWIEDIIKRATLTLHIPTIPIYRYWNPGVADHFYTTNWDEIKDGKDTGYNYEGVQCQVFKSPISSKTVPLHRYYNPKTGDHFYTSNWDEIKEGKHGYKYEGIQCHIYKSESGPGNEIKAKALFRYYNSKSGDHFYTTNWDELGDGKGGYSYEGIPGYCL